MKDFNYGETNCTLVCTAELGPFSPMRKEAANNIYVIPAPTRLTFGTVTLLCAACCIPAILSLISMWNKILEINWKSRSGAVAEKDPEERKVRDINALIKRFLNVIEAPLFGLAVVVILILGEINLFSHQVNYQTEPIQSIGQWAPIVGTGLAVLGSLIVNLTNAPEDSEDESVSGQPHPSTDGGSISNSSYPGSIQPVTEGPTHGRTKSTDLVPVVTRKSMASTVLTDKGGRRKMAQFMNKVGDYMGTPGHGQFDNSSFRRDASNYPTIPGEEDRNDRLKNTELLYNSGRSIRSVSRASEIRMSSPFSQDAANQRKRSDSIGARSIDSQDPPSPLTSDQGPITRGRSNTLTVPSPIHVPTREMMERSRTSNGPSNTN
ncbi:hypothetical protein E4T38_05200 [Aureobasidium subglaciale]|nr:hypothetical protein E4T38_05200 [Aureobasidium subglaciale]KAI5220324.1 hypothetical protein E4T40_05964 [Aureobasidium subglaciale]KAI5222911.1 hypothetical protein E4T41_06390 [Aureobasidium subglaciale]KAI5260136.1 hypothetical protein E4T46_06272 [Aureobasidium subglaciale]